MGRKDKINIDTFKVVTKAISKSNDLEMMASQMCQLLVAALEIKGCSIFLWNHTTEALDILASFGLSTRYLSKGPVLPEKSVGAAIQREPVIIKSTADDERLQYPDETRKEGVAAIVAIPIIFSGEVIGCMRLYHYESWDISDKDVDSLLLLGEIIGLALRYTIFLGATRNFSQVIKNLPVDLGLS